jgi:hypothetical protein
MLKRFILWDFPRATWQYDVMVGIIIAFIFLTPRDWFRDQPRIPRASKIAVLPAEHGSNVFVIDPELLAGVPEDKRAASVEQILKTMTGARRVEITRVEPIYDSESEIKGYMAFARP